MASEKMKLEPLDPDVRYSNQHYKIGDYLIAKDAQGTVDTIEWSISFNTWCYRVVGKKPPYWLYQTDITLLKPGAKRPSPAPPRPLPSPKTIRE